MSVASLIRISKEGPVTILTLDRAETMNPLGAPGDGDEFVQVANAINRDMECRVVILTGAGRAFSAGGDFVTQAGNAVLIAVAAADAIGAAGDGEQCLANVSAHLLAELTLSHWGGGGEVHGTMYGFRSDEKGAGVEHIVQMDPG